MLSFIGTAQQSPGEREKMSSRCYNISGGPVLLVDVLRITYYTLDHERRAGRYDMLGLDGGFI